jgi:hypothetical protein
MIYFFRTLLASFFIVALQPSCFAQTIAQSRVASAKLEKTTSDLLKITTNLIEINGPHLTDFELINYVHNSASASFYFFDKLWIVSSIHSLMIDPKDQQIVKGYVALQAKGAVAQADISIRHINNSLTRLKTQVAIFELMKARDLIQSMRDDVNQLIPLAK